MKNFLKNFIIFIFMMSPVFLFFLLIFLIETPYKFTVTHDNVAFFNNIIIEDCYIGLEEKDKYLMDINIERYSVNVGDIISFKSKYWIETGEIAYDTYLEKKDNTRISLIITEHNSQIESYIDKNAIHIADFVALLFILSIIINCIIINYTITKNKRLDYEK